jgi:hypothetical protein
MDPVKAAPAQSVKAPEATQRNPQQAKPDSSPEALAAKKAAEQAQRPTTNTQGQTLGRHLNVSA